MITIHPSGSDRRGAIDQILEAHIMKLFGPLTGAIALAGTVAAFAMPALAGPAEIAALDKYLGTWNGKGQVTGAQTNQVTCKMALSAGNGGKLNYTGRCS